jgi:hypothetical protein
VPSNNVTSKQEHGRNNSLDEKSKYGAGNTTDQEVKQQQINLVASVTGVPAKTSVRQWKTKVREPITARRFRDMVRVEIDADKGRQAECEPKNE